MPTVVFSFSFLMVELVSMLGGSERLFSRFRKATSYEDSVTYQVVDMISEAARIAAVCFVIDTIEVALEISGIKGRETDFSTIIAKLIYATWAFLRVRMYRRSFIVTVVDRTPMMMNAKGGIVEIFTKVTTDCNTIYYCSVIFCTKTHV